MLIPLSNGPLTGEHHLNFDSLHPKKKNKSDAERTMKSSTKFRNFIIFLGALVIILAFGGYTLAQEGEEEEQTRGPVCTFTGWNIEERACPEGMPQELFRDVNGRQENRLCCNPKHTSFKDIRNAAYTCRTTPCQDPSTDEPCFALDSRFIENGDKRLEYEEILRETCSMSDPDTGEGITGLCCVRNSTESYLATMMGAESNEFPHQAKLKLGCGGTVYNSRFVITAAHCVVSRETREVESPEGMEVVLGSNIGDMKGKEYIYGVKRLIPHPGYSWLKGSPELEEEVPRIFNDIALMELDREIEFSGKVRALEIAPEGFTPLEHSDKAVIVGWGTTDTLDLSVHLQKANFLIRRDQPCFLGEEAPYPEMEGLEGQLLCVGGIFEGKWSPTAGGGDSGGPAICRGPDGRALLCGVTSFGGDDEMCAANDNENSCIPSVYAEVPFFHDWIKEVAGDQDPETLYQPYLYGERIPLSQHEHQVRITSTDGRPCGGTLIAPDIVITAAQCVARGDNDSSDATFENLVVTSGLAEVTGQGRQTFGVSSVALLPGFQREGDPITPSNKENRILITDNFYKNDLAVIKLDGSVASPSTFPQLPTDSSYQPGSGEEMAFPRNTTYSAQMSRRQFRFLRRDDCQRRTNRMSRVGMDIKIDEDILCGVELYSGGSTCDRELGGGVICRGEGEGEEILCGVPVFRLCEFSIPNAFINVALQADWIRKAMQEL